MPVPRKQKEKEMSLAGHTRFVLGVVARRLGRGLGRSRKKKP